jgi:hypothetical protein
VKALFVTLVRSRLEYACCVWQPFYAVYIARIDRILENFVKYALRWLGWAPVLICRLTAVVVCWSIWTHCKCGVGSQEYYLFFTFYRGRFHHHHCWRKMVFVFRHITNDGNMAVLAQFIRQFNPGGNLGGVHSRHFISSSSSYRHVIFSNFPLIVHLETIHHGAVYLLQFRQFILDSQYFTVSDA